MWRHEHDDEYYDGGPCLGCGAPSIPLDELYDLEAVERLGLDVKELRARHENANGPRAGRHQESEL